MGDTKHKTENNNYNFVGSIKGQSFMKITKTNTSYCNMRFKVNIKLNVIVQLAGPCIRTLYVDKVTVNQLFGASDSCIRDKHPKAL